MFARRRSPQAAGASNAAQQSNDEMEDSHQNNTVASLAHTLVSTIADGVVHTIAHWKVILLGQGVSIVLAIAGATNEVLVSIYLCGAPSKVGDIIMKTYTYTYFTSTVFLGYRM